MTKLLLGYEKIEFLGRINRGMHCTICQKRSEEIHYFFDIYKFFDEIISVHICKECLNKNYILTQATKGKILWRKKDGNTNKRL